jgi:RHS repeat-associated protein
VGLDVDGTRTCVTYDAARNYLTKVSEEMATGAASSCATDDASDLIERFTRDSALRPTQVTAADGSCTHFEYDTKGRLARTKRRDDCNPASAGDREDYLYDADGRLTEVYTYDGASTLTRKQLASYHDSRRVQGVINPVDTSKLVSLTYDERGIVKEVLAEAGLGKVTLSIDADHHLASVTRAKSATASDTWTLGWGAANNLKTVTDPDGKVITTKYDDAGRLVQMSTPDNTMPRRRTYYPDGSVETDADDMQTQSFGYDAIGRLRAANLQGTCNASSPAEIEHIYDAVPLTCGIAGCFEMCPVAGECKHVGGRVAATRVTLMCSTAYGDGALDQWTYYSYDAAGRVVGEYIFDDTGRFAIQTFKWTKNGDLSEVTMPSTAKIGWTYGSAGSNADTDRVTAVWRTSTATPVIDNAQWRPYGPLAQYDRKDSIAGTALRMKVAYNLAYRPTSIRLEGQNGGSAYYQLLLAEDAKGRPKQRDYYPSDPQIPGVYDSFFLYDHQDRVLCETRTSVTSCPTTGTSIKNNHSAGFTGAGDRKTLLRPIPGSTGLSHVFALVPGKHQIASVAQTDGAPALGTTTYTHDPRGLRTGDNNAGPSTSHDARGYTYDQRDNLIRVTGSYSIGGTFFSTYAVTSAFDARGRRVFKSFEDTQSLHQKQWFFYYDPFGRLTEVRYIPNASVPTTYTTYQLFWLDGLLVAYWQTDAPSGTTTKRYTEFDETGRPVRMHSWPASGNSTVVWAINPDAWGVDKVIIGAGVYQPILFEGQYLDVETASYLDDGVTQHRPGLALNGRRTYDPFTGSYLQPDPLAHESWSSYMYADSNPVGNSDPSGLRARPMTEYICRSAGGGSADSIFIDGQEHVVIRDPVKCGWALNGGSFDDPGGDPIADPRSEKTPPGPAKPPPKQRQKRRPPPPPKPELPPMRWSDRPDGCCNPAIPSWAEDFADLDCRYGRSCSEVPCPDVLDLLTGGMPVWENLANRQFNGTCP